VKRRANVHDKKWFVTKRFQRTSLAEIKKKNLSFWAILKNTEPIFD
jgi:hypothetical protein